MWNFFYNIEGRGRRATAMDSGAPLLVWAWIRGEFKAGLSYLFFSVHDTFKETTK